MTSSMVTIIANASLNLDDRDLRKELSCYKCKQLLSPEVWTIQNEGNICGSCYQSFLKSDNIDIERPSHCTIFLEGGCRAVAVKNASLNMIVESSELILSCRHRDLGCGTSDTISKLHIHEKECSFNRINCFFQQCQWEGFEWEFMLHISSHNDCLITYKKDDPMTFSLDCSLKGTDIRRILKTIDGPVLLYYKVMPDRILCALFSRFHRLSRYHLELSSLDDTTEYSVKISQNAILMFDDLESLKMTVLNFQNLELNPENGFNIRVKQTIANNLKTVLLTDRTTFGSVCQKLLKEWDVRIPCDHSKHGCSVMRTLRQLDRVLYHKKCLYEHYKCSACSFTGQIWKLEEHIKSNHEYEMGCETVLNTEKPSLTIFIVSNYIFTTLTYVLSSKFHSFKVSSNHYFHKNEIEIQFSSSVKMSAVNELIISKDDLNKILEDKDKKIHVKVSFYKW